MGADAKILLLSKKQTLEAAIKAESSIIDVCANEQWIKLKIMGVPYEIVGIGRAWKSSLPAWERKMDWRSPSPEVVEAVEAHQRAVVARFYMSCSGGHRGSRSGGGEAAVERRNQSWREEVEGGGVRGGGQRRPM